MDLLKEFRDYVARRGMFADGERILAGVSGGVDSMVLLDLLVRSLGTERLAAAHCNFSLRGRESDGDQELVRKVCEASGVPLHTARFDTSREADRHGESIQMAARRLRYAWFGELAQEHGYDKIAIAHQADDSTETFFINLVRGTGLRGLTGIADRRGSIVRPLLFAGRDQITAYAAERGIAYRNDSTNESVKYLRNRLRHEIIPLFSSSSRNFAQTMEGNLSRLQEAQRFIDRQIERLRDAAVKNDVIDLEKLSPDTLKFELYELLAPYGFSGEVIEEMVRTLGGRQETISGKQFFGRAWKAVLDRGRIILTPPCEEESLREEYIAQDDPRIEWLSVAQLPASLAAPPNVAYLAADALRFPLHLRRWREGDWFIPLGMHGQKKVSDFLIDTKVPLTEKNRQGVLLSGETVVWLTGRRIDDRYKVLPCSSRVIRITL